jgi:hypothetical protein
MYEYFGVIYDNWKVCPSVVGDYSFNSASRHFQQHSRISLKREWHGPWKSKQSYIFLCVCVCVRACACIALLTQHAKDMHSIILTHVASLASPYFATLSHKWHHFRKSLIEHNMCVLRFSTTFMRNIFHYRKNLAKYYRKCRNVFM